MANSQDDKSVDSLSAAVSKDNRLVRELRSKLASLGGEKASEIRQLREVNSQLQPLVSRIGELKSARDKETAAVRELKAKRQAANDAMRAIGPEMKKALDAKEAAGGSLSKAKGKGRRSAGQLYAEMEALEMRIITEAMPFSREKELMKIIKEKKKQMEAVRSFSETMKSHRELFSRFSESRRQSFAFHAGVQQHAEASQRFHEEMIAAIGQVRELRERKKALLGTLHTAKAAHASAAASLNEASHELSEIKGRLDAIAAERRKAEIAQKENQLTEKLKSGKKLTARDLMMLQND